MDGLMIIFWNGFTTTLLAVTPLIPVGVESKLVVLNGFGCETVPIATGNKLSKFTNELFSPAKIFGKLLDARVTI